MALTNTNINTLITLCKSNNRLAQLEVYNRYHKAMYNTALRIVKNTYDAEDVMQNAFIKAFEKLNTLNDTSLFTAWLKRIVVNQSIQQYQKKTKHHEVDYDTVSYAIETNTNEGLAQQNTNVKVTSILNALDALKPNYRMALTLHLIEGYDYEEIAQIMNLSQGNCRTLISRAKTHLRKLLEYEK